MSSESDVSLQRLPVNGHATMTRAVSIQNAKLQSNITRLDMCMCVQQLATISDITIIHIYTIKHHMHVVTIIKKCNFIISHLNM